MAEALDQTLERRPPLLVLSEPRPPRQSSSEAGDVAVHIGKNGRRNLRAREGDKIDLDSISNASGADHEGGGARPPLSRLAAGTAFAASNDFLSTLLPSVRCGIEMALVHLVARASGTGIGPALGTAAGLSARNSIEINGLATRGEGLSIGQSGQVSLGRYCRKRKRDFRGNARGFVSTSKQSRVDVDVGDSDGNGNSRLVFWLPSRS